MQPLNWAILGPGTIAADFAQALQEVHGEIYAVGSRTLEKALQFANKFGIKKAYGSYEEMLEDPEIDVVYISTPHSNHFEYIMKSLKNNKHVLCEKAITVSSQELDTIIQVANEKQLIIAEAMTIFHMPLFKELKKVINNGKIGTLKMITATFGSCKEDDPSNRFFNMELAGGALLDIGTYALSFTRYFLSSQPHEILTTVKEYVTGADEQSGIILKNDKNEMAVVTLTMRARMPKVGVLAGDLGFITVQDYPRATKAIITYLDGSQETVEAGDSSKALQYEIQAMEHYISTNSSQETLTLSKDVMNIMTNVRSQWGITYPFEK